MSKFKKIIPSGSNFKQIFFKDGLTHINNNIRCNFVFDCLLMWKILILIYLLLILMTKKAMKHCKICCRIHSKINSLLHQSMNTRVLRPDTFTRPYYPLFCSLSVKTGETIIFISNFLSVSPNFVFQTFFITVWRIDWKLLV